MKSLTADYDINKQTNTNSYSDKYAGLQTDRQRVKHNTRPTNSKKDTHKDSLNT